MSPLVEKRLPRQPEKRRRRERERMRISVEPKLPAARITCAARTLRGGAAGLEIDSYDRALGSPPHALVVASSEGHSNTFELVNEAVLVAHGATDGPQNAAIRADMVFFECPNGGAVFHDTAVWIRRVDLSGAGRI